MRRATVLLLVSSVLSCSAFLGDDPEEPVDDPVGSVVRDATLTTEVDPSTLAPASPGGTAFPASTRALYLCFRVVAGRTGDGLVVTWHRGDEAEPFETTRLVVTGRRWMTAAYEPIGRLLPGAYAVRVTAGETLLEVIDFVVEAGREEGGAETAAALEVSPLRFVATLDGAGRPTGSSLTVLSPGSRRVHCALVVTGGTSETRLEVRWLRGGSRLSTGYLGVSGSDRQELVATLDRPEGLTAGLYRVEVATDGRVVRSGSFTVEEESPAAGSGPRVSNLVLTTAVEARTGRPTGPPLTTVRGDESVLFLTLTFAGMPDDDTLEVRWYRDAQPGEPLASGTYAVAGRGSLAASFEPGDPLAVGAHHVDVVRAGAVLRTLAFTVDRPAGEAETE